MSSGLALLVNNYDVFEFAKAMYEILLACFSWTPRESECVKCAMAQWRATDMKSTVGYSQIPSL